MGRPAHRSSASPTTPTVTKVTVPSLTGLTPAQATANLATAGLVITVDGDTSNPEFGALTQEPMASTQLDKGATVSVNVGESPAQPQARQAAEAAAAAAAAQAASDADLSTYQEIDDRTWAFVAKDPKSHVGEKYVIYGDVTQFDSATGTSTFRANTGGEQQEYSYKYDVNTMVSSTDPAQVADIVEDDQLKMYVRISGALTYSTQIGGSATVPQVVINGNDLVGHNE